MHKRNQAMTQFMGYLVIKYLLCTYSMANMLKRGARGSSGQRGSGDVKILMQKNPTKKQHPFTFRRQEKTCKQFMLFV